MRGGQGLPGVSRAGSGCRGRGRGQAVKVSLPVEVPASCVGAGAAPPAGTRPGGRARQLRVGPAVRQASRTYPPPCARQLRGGEGPLPLGSWRQGRRSPAAWGVGERPSAVIYGEVVPASCVWGQGRRPALQGRGVSAGGVGASPSSAGPRAVTWGRLLVAGVGAGVRSSGSASLSGCLPVAWGLASHRLALCRYVGCPLVVWVGAGVRPSGSASLSGCPLVVRGWGRRLLGGRPWWLPVGRSSGAWVAVLHIHPGVLVGVVA